MPGVIAWIVAVERHTPPGDPRAGSPGLDFKQAVSARALDWARWLSTQPGVRLLMNVSAAPGSAQADALQALSPQLLNPNLAARADGKALSESLRLLRAAPLADTLLLLWIGHGVMRDHQRFLVNQDARSPDDLRSWELDSLLQALRTDPAPPLQIGVFDTCAQLLADRPGHEVITGNGKAQRRQHFYFAATASAIASLNPNEATLASLALEALQAQPWPPQPAGFGSSLQASMGRLASLPVAWEWTAGSGDRWSSGAPAPRPGADDEAEREARLSQLGRQSPLGERCLRHLWRELTPAQCSPEQLAHAVHQRSVAALADTLAPTWPDTAEALRRAWARVQRIQPWLLPLAGLRLLLPQWLALADQLARHDARSAPRFTELRELLLWALDMDGLDAQGTARAEAALLRLMVMALREAEHSQTADAPTRAGLRQQLEADAVLGPLLPQVEADTPQPAAVLVLQVELDLPANTSQPVIKDCWLLRGAQREPGPRRRPKGPLGEQLNTLLNQVLTSHVGELRVELVAPLELLAGRPEWVSYRYDNDADACIGLDTLFAICWRWRERLKDRHPHSQFSLWQRNAPRVQQRVRQRLGLHCQFDDEPVVVDQDDLLGLSWHPPGPGEAGPRRQQFLQALVGGHPYMLWPGSVPADVAALKAQVKAWLAGQTLQALPEQLREARRRGQLPPLVLFVDEPDRNPYPAKTPGLRTPSPARR